MIVNFPGFGIEPQSKRYFGRGLFHVAVFEQHPRFDGVAVGQIGVQRERLLRCSEAAIALAAMIKALMQLRLRLQRPGAGISRIDLDGAAAQPDDGFRPAAIADVTLDEILAGHQIEIVGFDAVRAAPFDGFLFFRKQFQLQRLDDGFGDFVLQREDVVQVAVVAFGQT